MLPDLIVAKLGVGCDWRPVSQKRRVSEAQYIKDWKQKLGIFKNYSPIWCGSHFGFFSTIQNTSQFMSKRVFNESNMEDSAIFTPRKLVNVLVEGTFLSTQIENVRHLKTFVAFFKILCNIWEYGTILDNIYPYMVTFKLSSHSHKASCNSQDWNFHLQLE